jgi:hypothetical protein
MGEDGLRTSNVLDTCVDILEDVVPGEKQLLEFPCRGVKLKPLFPRLVNSPLRCPEMHQDSPAYLPTV